MKDIAKRCCNFDCEVEKISNEGYRVSFGFMLWACSGHAEQWKDSDEQMRQYDHKSSNAFQVAYKEWEEIWYRRFELENPRPIPPKYQPSRRDQ